MTDRYYTHVPRSGVIPLGICIFRKMVLLATDRGAYRIRFGGFDKLILDKIEPKWGPHMNNLLQRLRALEADHDPEGWPAVQMQDITALLDACESLRIHYDSLEGTATSQAKEIGRLAHECKILRAAHLQIKSGIKADFSLDAWLEWESGQRRLEDALREIVEIYAGMEGITLKTDTERYLMRIVKQMFEASKVGHESN